MWTNWGNQNCWYFRVYEGTSCGQLGHDKSKQKLSNRNSQNTRWNPWVSILSIHLPVPSSCGVHHLYSTFVSRMDAVCKDDVPKSSNRETYGLGPRSTTRSFKTSKVSTGRVVKHIISLSFLHSPCTPPVQPPSRASHPPSSIFFIIISPVLAFLTALRCLSPWFTAR